MSAIYGVPQKGERFILYAVPDDKQLPQWPKQTHFIVEETPIEHRDLYALNGVIPTPTVDEAFRGMICYKCIRERDVYIILYVYDVY